MVFPTMRGIDAWKIPFPEGQGEMMATAFRNLKQCGKRYKTAEKGRKNPEKGGTLGNASGGRSARSAEGMFGDPIRIGQQKASYVQERLNT